MKQRVDVFQVLVVAVCVTAAVVTIYPMWYVLAMSLNDPYEAVKGNLLWNLFPIQLYLGSYEVILKDSGLWRAAGMSIFYAVSGTLLMLITSVMGAYPLTRPNLKFRKIVVIFLIIPMYFSGGMIPTFLIVQKLGLYDTIWAIILPGAYSIWNIILTRTFFMTIPGEVAESAFIDGANHFQLMRKIYLPLSKPVLAVISIYTLVGIWNSWFNAMVYLPNYTLHPLQMYLQRILIAQTVDVTRLKEVTSADDMAALMKKAMGARQLKYAMIMVVSLPILMVYPMFQRHFVKGVMLGSLKG
ncbi:MAG: carbohydrate ABC transporter permease [Christensenellales bacterium]|jgi:putative aldouronate transport system permease protein